MRAAVLAESGPEKLTLMELPDPTFGPDEVLVRVHASGLNRTDLSRSRGRFPEEGIYGDIPGLEIAGVIESVGERVLGWKAGDRVMALLRGRGYSSCVAVHERMLMRIPSNLSFIEAAGIPEVFLTAYDALFPQCQLSLGESVLIHAAGSGVGTAAIQLAAVHGNRIFGTAGSAEKLERCRALGLDVGINYREQDFADVVLEHTNGVGVNVLFDLVGAPYWNQNLRALASKGRMIVVGTLGGTIVDQMNVNMFISKRATVRGTGLQGRQLEEKASLVQTFIQRILPLFADGTIAPIIDRVFPFEEVGAAQQLMESNENFGKIMLSIEQ